MQVGKTYIFKADASCGKAIQQKTGAFAKIIKVKNDNECIIRFETGESIVAFVGELSIAS